MTAIVIATKNGRCLPVLAMSITYYVPQEIPIYVAGSDVVFPRHRTINLPNEYGNFGDSYNYVCFEAFKEHEDIIVANDDIVLRPDTWQLLMEDINGLVGTRDNTGWVASRSDMVRGKQNIRSGDVLSGLKYSSENQLIETQVIAPIFSWIQKEKWIDFPPINWYGDDIQCFDMVQKGYKHYVSRSYVHHVGHQTVGDNHVQCHKDAEPWIKKNRPELWKRWFTKD